jgi:putative intracellular protease/amidase
MLCTTLLSLWFGLSCKPVDSGVFPTYNVLFIVSSHDKLGETGKPTGFWLPELTHPYYATHRLVGNRNLNVVIASPKGGKAPIDPHSIDLKDPDNKRFMEEAETKNAIENTTALSQIAPSDYHGVLFVGGHGPMWDLVNDPDAQRITRALYDKRLPIAAVCHGPAALVNVKLKDGKYLVAGKKLTAFTNAEEEKAGYTKVVPFQLEAKLKQRGAKFIAAPPHMENVVVDGNLVTGQNPASARELGVKFAKLASQSHPPGDP